jgi:hypothetical protein
MSQDSRERSLAAIETAQQAIRRSEARREHTDRIAVPTAAVRRDRAAKQLRTDRDGPPEMPLWLRRAV